MPFSDPLMQLFAQLQRQNREGPVRASAQIGQGISQGASSIADQLNLVAQQGRQDQQIQAQRQFITDRDKAQQGFTLGRDAARDKSADLRNARQEADRLFAQAGAEGARHRQATDVANIRAKSVADELSFKAKQESVKRNAAEVKARKATKAGGLKETQRRKEVAQKNVLSVRRLQLQERREENIVSNRARTHKLAVRKLVASVQNRAQRQAADALLKVAGASEKKAKELLNAARKAEERAVFSPDQFGEQARTLREQANQAKREWFDAIDAVVSRFGDLGVNTKAPTEGEVTGIAAESVADGMLKGVSNGG